MVRAARTSHRTVPLGAMPTLVASLALAAALIVTSWAVESRSVAQMQPLPPFQQFVSEVRPGLVSDRLAQAHYTFEERQLHYHHDANGKLTQTIETMIEWYTALDADLEYERVVSVNGKRVSTADLERRDREHEKKVQEWEAKVRRAGSTPADWRRTREAIEHTKERGVIDELFLLYDIKMLYREVIGGRPAIAFSLAPRSGYQPRQPDAQLAKHFAGRIWIDEVDHQLVRIEMEALENVSYGLGIVARLNKGSRAEFERSRLEDGTWLPVRSHIIAGGRVLLVKRIAFDQVSEYRNYKPQPIDGIPTVGGFPKTPSAYDLTASLGRLIVRDRPSLSGRRVN